MEQDLTKGHARFTSFNHPLIQAQAWSMPALYDWQIEIMDEVALPSSRVAVSTNNESGKTRILVPLLGLSVMAAFPGATIVSTAGAEEQIRGQLFKYLDGILRPYSNSGWSVSVSELTVKAPRVRGLQSRWIARVPKEALTLEGYHGEWSRDDKGNMCWCPVCMIIDEAKSVETDIFEAMWRIDPDFALVISTPGEDAGPFYKAIDPDTLDCRKKSDPAGLWTYRRQISWRDCPHLLTPGKLARREKLIEKYGQRSSFIKSFLDGEFQRQTDDNEVFTDTDLMRVKAAMRQRPEYTPGKKFASLDFSGGGDEQPIGILDGDKVIYKNEWREEDTDKLAMNFLVDLKRFGVEPRNTIADNGGLGQAVIDNMEAKGFRGIMRYMNNQDPINRHEYADRITEDHYRFKEMLRLHPEIQIPDDPVLLRQMRQRRFRVNDHNQIKLEEKKAHRKRTGESPDRLEMIIMLFSDWRPPVKDKPKDDYRSSLEEESRRKAGTGAKSAFGWVRPQKNMADMMRKHIPK